MLNLEEFPQPLRQVRVICVLSRKPLQQRVQRVPNHSLAHDFFHPPSHALLLPPPSSGDEALQEDCNTDLEEGPIYDEDEAAHEEDDPEVDESFLGNPSESLQLNINFKNVVCCSDLL